MESKPNKNDALEALDFIINVLKEHEKDLDRLINQLSIITESLGETGEITGKIEKIEDRITNLQDEITSLIKNVVSNQQQQEVPHSSNVRSSSVTVKCRRWEDFKQMAACSETVSYTFKISDNSFKADAIKNGRILTYIGEFPSNTNLLKLWLSKELKVAEEDVFEGELDLN
ncbi:MAG: hypothetical protein WC325_00825 [Candidatus Bathyarchaeia archaeon]|jgi:hypothetical protein